METKFEIGDVVRLVKHEPHMSAHGYEPGGEYTVTGFQVRNKCLETTAGKGGWDVSRFELVRRASESQRKSGFAVGQRVRRKGTETLGILLSPEYSEFLQADGWIVRVGARGEPECFWLLDNIEPADAAPVLTHCKRCTVENDGHYVQLDPEGLCGHCVADLMNGGPQVVPPQPAPMTRAARVLAGMMADPYEQARNKVEARIGLDTQNHLDHYTATATDNEPEQQAARLRMAKLTLDRPLDAERARWERLVLARVPAGRR